MRDLPINNVEYWYEEVSLEDLCNELNFISANTIKKLQSKNKERCKEAFEAGYDLGYDEATGRRALYEIFEDYLKRLEDGKDKS